MDNLVSSMDNLKIEVQQAPASNGHCNFVVPSYGQPCDNLPLDKTFLEYKGGAKVKRISDIISKKMVLLLPDKNSPYSTIDKFIKRQMKKKTTVLYAFNLKNTKLVPGINKSNFRASRASNIFVLKGKYNNLTWVYSYFYRNKKSFFSPYLLALKKQVPLWAKYNMERMPQSSITGGLLINKIMKGGADGAEVDYTVTGIDDINGVFGKYAIQSYPAEASARYNNVISITAVADESTKMLSPTAGESPSVGSELSGYENVKLYSESTGGAKSETLDKEKLIHLKSILNKFGYSSKIEKYSKGGFILNIKDVPSRTQKGGVSYSFNLAKENMINGLPEVVKYDFCEAYKLGEYL
jgi:hypothetical protein